IIFAGIIPSPPRKSVGLIINHLCTYHVNKDKDVLKEQSKPKGKEKKNAVDDIVDGKRREMVRNAMKNTYEKLIIMLQLEEKLKEQESEVDARNLARTAYLNTLYDLREQILAL
ncbi:MAG: hypothetical protein EZS28_037055, partial [Streblomastix strix]